MPTAARGGLRFAAPCMLIEFRRHTESIDNLRATCAAPLHVPGNGFFRSSRALALSGVGEKGGARLLGCAAVQPFYNTINDLKNRLRLEQKPRMTVRNCRHATGRELCIPAMRIEDAVRGHPLNPYPAKLSHNLCSGAAATV